MQTLEMLGVAVGLAGLAGINLYLTVFAAGMAIRFGWVALPENLHQLQVLGDPWIIGIAGVLYLFEFFADKVPWVDSLWDSVHTFIRPVGAAFLAVLALGNPHPAVEVVAALLAGGLALTTHVAKSGMRLAANASPEPLTNIGLSLAGDAVVIGGLGLVSWHPIIALLVCLVAVGLIWWLLPKLIRGTVTKVWLAWRKFNAPPEGRELPLEAFKAPSDVSQAIQRVFAKGGEIHWAAPCFSGGGDRLPSNVRGWLVSLAEPESRLFFVSRRWFRGQIVVEIPAADSAVNRESRFLCEKLTLVGNGKWSFLFERGHRLVAQAIAANLSTRRASETPTQLLEPLER